MRPLSSRVTFAAPRNIVRRRDRPISPHFFPLDATIEMLMPACQRLNGKFLKRSRYLRAAWRPRRGSCSKDPKEGLYADQRLEPESSTIFDFLPDANGRAGC